MKHRLKVVIVALGIVAALAAVPALSFAQSSPPPPPVALIYGQVSGGTAGQPVIAFIRTGGSTTTCGVGFVTNQPGVGTVYLVDVESNSHINGCGASGREVRLYFARTANTPGRLATQTVTLTSAVFQERELDVTLGTPLSNQVVAPAMGARVSH